MNIPVEVLLVEDSVEDAELIKSKLRRTQFIRANITQASWLSTALQAIDSRTFDIILLDLTLGDSSGVETAVSVIRAAPNVPVLVLSGRDDLQVSMNSVSAGAQSFIVKRHDISTEMLEREIIYALKRKHRETQAKRMLIESHSNINSTEFKGAGALVPHIVLFEEMFHRIKEYLVINAPSAYDRVTELLEEGGVDAAFREVRSLMSLYQERATKPPPSPALRALQKQVKTDPNINTPVAAKEAISELITEWDPDIWG